MYLTLQLAKTVTLVTKLLFFKYVLAYYFMSYGMSNIICVISFHLQVHLIFLVNYSIIYRFIQNNKISTIIHLKGYLHIIFVAFNTSPGSNIFRFILVVKSKHVIELNTFDIRYNSIEHLQSNLKFISFTLTLNVIRKDEFIFTQSICSRLIPRRPKNTF